MSLSSPKDNSIIWNTTVELKNFFSSHRICFLSGINKSRMLVGQDSSRCLFPFFKNISFYPCDRWENSNYCHWETWRNKGQNLLWCIHQRFNFFDMVMLIIFINDNVISCPYSPQALMFIIMNTFLNVFVFLYLVNCNTKPLSNNC